MPPSVTTSLPLSAAYWHPWPVSDETLGDTSSSPSSSFSSPCNSPGAFCHPASVLPYEAQVSDFNSPPIDEESNGPTNLTTFNGNPPPPHTNPHLEVMCLNNSSDTKEKKRRPFSDEKVEWVGGPWDIILDEGTTNDEPIDLQPQTIQYDNQEDAAYAAIVNDLDTSFHTHSDPSPTPLKRLVA